MPDDPDVKGGANRRQFLRMTLAGLAVAVAHPSGIAAAAARLPATRAPRSADGALEELLAGNARYVANRLTFGQHDLRALRSQTVETQTPFAAVLGCADSRVPVELVFDQSIGQLFVTRVAGNFAAPDIIASLEYGVAVLKVRAILVLGHAHCGAVKAAMKAETVPGQISSLYAPLRQAVQQSGGDVEKAVTINARLQADLLRSSSTVVHEAIAARTLAVAAGVYDLASGKVSIV